jgi:hypothetical protein
MSGHSHSEYDAMDLATIKASGLFREDAVEFGGSSMYFARQLDFVKARAYNQLYPEMKSAILVPDDTDMPEWIETLSVVSYEAVGMAKIIANYADDLPRADVRGVAQVVGVKTIGDSYGYNVNEIRASQANGFGLDARKAESARLAVEIKLAKLRLVGDDEYGLYGIFTYPNIPEVVLPFAGDWGLLSGNEVLGNLIAMQEAYYKQNKGVHLADMLALPPDAYSACVTKMLTAGVSPTSPLDYYQRLYPNVRVERIYECQGAQITTAPIPVSHDVAMLYERRIENLAHLYVMPFTQLPPEARNLEFVINAVARSAGVQVWRPLALIQAITS